MPLPALEPVAESVRTWASERSLSVYEGIIELDDSFPQITVVGFDATDIGLFLTLAAVLKNPVMVLHAPPLTDEDLRLAKGLAADLKANADRTYYARVVEEARAQLGRIHDLTAFAFAADLSRAVVFRASTDWAEPVFGLIERVTNSP